MKSLLSIFPYFILDILSENYQTDPKNLFTEKSNQKIMSQD